MMFWCTWYHSAHPPLAAFAPFQTTAVLLFIDLKQPACQTIKGKERVIYVEAKGSEGAVRNVGRLEVVACF